MPHAPCPCAYCPPRCDCLDCTDLGLWCALYLGTLRQEEAYTQLERQAQRMLVALEREGDD